MALNWMLRSKKFFTILSSISGRGAPIRNITYRKVLVLLFLLILTRGTLFLQETKGIHCSSSLSGGVEYSPRGPPYTVDLSAASTPAATDQLRPIYRIMNSDGIIIDQSQDPNVHNNCIVYM